MQDRKKTAEREEFVLTEKQVMDFLTKNPDFLVKNLKLLEKLEIPNRSSDDSVVDLQHFVIQRLREVNEGQEKLQKQLIETSRTNLTIQQYVHEAILTLLSAQSLQHLLELTATEIAVLVDVDVVSVCFEESPLLTDETRQSAIIIEPGLIDQIMGPKKNILLRSNIQGDPRIFGFASEMVRSDAYSRLDSHMTNIPRSALVFGSRNPKSFYPNQGSELLSFLTRVLELCISRWLD